MGDIKQVVKNTLVKLQSKDLLATPDNYYKEFAIQSKLEDEKIHECEVFDQIVSTLANKGNISTYSELVLALSKNTNNPKELLLILNDILAPSINHDIEIEIDKLTNYLLENPEELSKKETLSKLKNITKQRIKNDKKIVKEKSTDLKKISDLMAKYFSKMILESGNSFKSVESIKNDIESLTISDSSKRELSRLQGKLVATIYTLEMNMQKNQEVLLEQQSEFAKLEERIKKLQNELDQSKEENELDYLTNILNRRAFENEAQKLEKKYKMFNKDYAIVFYDIDHFKNINDTYGHGCGDAVLRTFAGILKNLSRDNDVVSRYGGEEFVILLDYEKTDDLSLYIQRVKTLMEKSEFNYKEHKDIDVKFSAGLCIRSNYNSFDEALEKADSLLFEAKNSGRYKTIMDNGTIL